MVDNVSRKKRSEVMAAVKQKNTRPEKAVRSYLHSKGFRFRLHDKKLPGKPDIILPKHNTAIFVHGCFWHGHEKKTCKLARMPKSNIEFWSGKIKGNSERDLLNQAKLRALGWKVRVAWECSLESDIEKIAKEMASL